MPPDNHLNFTIFSHGGQEDSAMSINGTLTIPQQFYYIYSGADVNGVLDQTMASGVYAISRFKEG